jgi:hypothetical protein
MLAAFRLLDDGGKNLVGSDQLLVDNRAECGPSGTRII